MEATVSLFVTTTKIFQFKAKYSKIKSYPLFLENISKDFSVNNMIKAALNIYAYGFSVDYNINDTSNIIDIHNYLMKKHDIKCCFDLLKKYIYIGLLSVCTIGSIDESIVSNSKGPIKCVSLNNRPCQARPTLVNINSDETHFYKSTLNVIKSGGIVTLSIIHILEFVFQIK